MMKRGYVGWLIIGCCVACGATTSGAGDWPHPNTSIVDPRLVVCPMGDIPFHMVL